MLTRLSRLMFRPRLRRRRVDKDLLICACLKGLSLVNKVKGRETVESSGLITLEWPLNFPLELHGQQNLEIQGVETCRLRWTATLSIRKNNYSTRGVISCQYGLKWPKGKEHQI